MYKPREMLEAEAKKKAEGNPDPSAFEFRDNKHHRDLLLHRLPTVEHLTCDIMLELYILDTREFRHFMPNLKSINKVPIELKVIEERTKEKKILEIMNKMWRYVQSYRLVKPGAMDEDPTFYINDEVGVSVAHNDKPNSVLAPLIYSPNCEVSDSQTMTYSLLWLTGDVKKSHFVYRDYLRGVDESQWRSARLLPWFNVFEEYYAQEYKKFVDYKPPVDAMALHQKYQDEYPTPS